MICCDTSGLYHNVPDFPVMSVLHINIITVGRVNLAGQNQVQYLE